MSHGGGVGHRGDGVSDGGGVSHGGDGQRGVAVDGDVGSGDSEAVGVADVVSALDQAVGVDVGEASLGDTSDARLNLAGGTAGVAEGVLSQLILRVVLSTGAVAGQGQHLRAAHRSRREQHNLHKETNQMLDIVSKGR